MSTKLPFLVILLFILKYGIYNSRSNAFTLKETTIDDLELAFKQNELTSRQLVEFYLKQIHRLNPLLRGVIEVNTDALYLADKADQDRKVKEPGLLPSLHGIPVLLKDNIATKDKLNTTAGSYALFGSIVPRHAGKASLSEWAGSRSFKSLAGFCGRSCQGRNPYVLSASPCGSSSGSGISVAANLAAVSLGTETGGSILCQSGGVNSVVGIKPTVGLTSRAGKSKLNKEIQTLLNGAGLSAALKYIRHGGYKQFLKQDRLKGKRLGIVISPFFNFTDDEGSVLARAFENHIQTLRQNGAEEKLKEYGQDFFEKAESLNTTDDEYKGTLSKLHKYSRHRIEKVMRKYKVDALVTPGAGGSPVLAIGGYPGFSVPAGYDSKGLPYGICFGGLKGTEPKLIEIAYGFEQATKIRKPPSFIP
ncbi:amidase, putative [Ricinus communis]|uniref:Amidase, putative n=1 Tax=Ricinus communis TaxID=3988 RepID=B9SQK6_RICCO|nr:amidase, putative [Ricinus communis]